MIVDKHLAFSVGQAITAAADSTDYWDQGVAGGRDVGTGEDLYLVTVVATALTDGGSNTSTVVALQGDSATTFTPDATIDMYSFPQAAAAGTVRFKKLSPGDTPLQLRYVNVRYAPAGASLTGGTFTTFITTDVSRYVSYNDAVTIS